MDYKYESSIINGIIAKHCFKELYHGELDLFFEELSPLMSSTCVEAIDLFSSDMMTEKNVKEFNEIKDAVFLKLTILLKTDVNEYSLYVFNLYSYVGGHDSEFNLKLDSKEVFNIPIAETLEELVKNHMVNFNISDFIQRHMRSLDYNKFFIRDTFNLDFSNLYSVYDSLNWIEGFINNKGNNKSKRFIR